MIFVQGCSVSDSNTTNNTQDNDDEIIKNGNGNLDKPSVNLANTCPRGLACALPGRCTLFTDQNYDKLCDRSTTQNQNYGRGL